MSWPFVVFQRVNLRDLVKELRRCAEALERIAPLPEDAPAELKPEDAVSYVDEEKLAQRELAEEAGAMQAYMAAHPEEFPEDESSESH